MGSHVWQDVGKGWLDYSKFSVWCLENGENINLWDDNWTGKGPLISLIYGPLNVNGEKRPVSSLIRDNAWYFQNISLAIPVHIQQWILAIPIPARGGDFPVSS